MTDTRDEAITLRNVEPGDGFWHSCSGCHETNEGAETGWYPYSKTFGCYLGAGCSECGGLGAVWNGTDYSDMGDFLAEQDAEKDRIAALEEQVARLERESAESRDRALMEAKAKVTAWMHPRHALNPGEEAVLSHCVNDILALRSRPSPAPSEAVREAASTLLRHEPRTAVIRDATVECCRVEGWTTADLARHRKVFDAALRALASEGEREGDTP